MIAGRVSYLIITSPLVELVNFQPLKVVGELIIHRSNATRQTPNIEKNIACVLYTEICYFVWTGFFAEYFHKFSQSGLILFCMYKRMNKHMS